MKPSRYPFVKLKQRSSYSLERKHKSHSDEIPRTGVRVNYGKEKTSIPSCSHSVNVFILKQNIRYFFICEFF